MVLAMLLWMQLTPGWIVIAPGIQARPNTAVGDAAFYSCMLNTQSSVACEPVRQTAIQLEAATRFKQMFDELAAGKVRSASAMNKLLVKYGMARF